MRARTEEEFQVIDPGGSRGSFSACTLATMDLQPWNRFNWIPLLLKRNDGLLPCDRMVLSDLPARMAIAQLVQLRTAEGAEHPFPVQAFNDLKLLQALVDAALITEFGGILRSLFRQDAESLFNAKAPKKALIVTRGVSLTLTKGDFMSLIVLDKVDDTLSAASRSDYATAAKLHAEACVYAASRQARHIHEEWVKKSAPELGVASQRKRGRQGAEARSQKAAPRWEQAKLLVATVLSEGCRSTNYRRSQSYAVNHLYDAYSRAAWAKNKAGETEYEPYQEGMFKRLVGELLKEHPGDFHALGGPAP